MLASHKTVSALLCLAGMAPSYCAGTGHAHLTTPLGNYGVGYSYKKENRTLVIVTTTLPPGYPGGETEVEGRTVKLPKNPTESPMQITVEAKDPVILQIPVDWSFDGATITTPLGSGNVLTGPGSVPSMINVSSNGQVAFTDLFTPEPGYKLVFCDVPPNLASLGTVSGTLFLGVPDSARRVETIKMIETWRVTATLPSGSFDYFAPIGPEEHDFANVNDMAHSFIIDATEVPCTSPAGFSPRSELPSNDWQLGVTTSVDASNLDPSKATSFMFGYSELPNPVTLGTSGCKLLIGYQDAIGVAVNASGDATLPVTIPVNSSYVGLNMVWQPAQLDPAANDVVTGTMLRVRIEP